MARPKILKDTKPVIVHLFPDDYSAIRAILFKQGKSFASFVRDAIQKRLRIKSFN